MRFAGAFSALPASVARPRGPAAIPGLAPGILTRRALALIAGIAAGSLFALPAFAQHHGSPEPPGYPVDGPPQPLPGNLPLGMAQPDESDPFNPPRAPVPGVIMVNSESAHMVESEACNSWTESSVHSPTVSVSRLEIPDKASSEFQRACSSYKGKRLSEAEDHVRKALDLYPAYAAGWVLLGQILDAEKHDDDASKACSHATTLDPKYVAPYLCLAEFAARTEDWEEVSRLSDQALAIDPTSNPYALYYSAAANFHLRHLPDAETNAKAAAQLDPWHHLPQVHLLLANIYAARNDPRSEMGELKEFLKVASSSPDAAVARAMLKGLAENPASNASAQTPAQSQSPAPPQAQQTPTQSASDAQSPAQGQTAPAPRPQH